MADLKTNEKSHQRILGNIPAISDVHYGWKAGVKLASAARVNEGKNEAGARRREAGYRNKAEWLSIIAYTQPES